MGIHSHIKQLRKQFGLFLLLLMIGPPMFTGCAVHRDLRISEVGLHAVELYLAEDSGNRLALADHTLMYKNSNGLEGEVDLGVFATLPGGGWLVVWEEQNYSGPPEKEDFVNFFGRSVPGIKVSDDFFGIGISYSYRVSGKHPRGFITDKTDDVVKFGVQPRPSIGGSFIEDGSLANKVPSQSRTISRKWGTNHPIDNDREDDWIKKTQSFGGPTLP